jgi:hypothetical protein
MSNDKKQIQEKLASWAKETVKEYNSIAETLNKKNPNKKWGYYTQTPLSLVSQSPDLLILGINPGSEGGKNKMTEEELLKGNPCFEGLSKEGVVNAMREDPDVNKKRKGWALWHRLNNMLEKSSKNKELLQDFNKFVLSNMIFFGTAKENQIPKIDKDKCAELTLKLIDNLEPKVVLLLGKQCRDLFNRLNKNGKLEVLIPNSIYHCMYGKSHILAIKHTAYYYSNEEIEVVGKTIGYVLDNHNRTINKETISVSYIKEDIIRFEERLRMIQSKRKIKTDGNPINENEEKQLTIQTLEGKIKTEGKLKETELFKLFKAKIDPCGSNSCALFYRGKLLNYEYYTNINENKKYVNNKDTIAIDFLTEDNKYIIRVGTRRNDPEKNKKIAIAIDGEFRPGNTDVTASHWHIHKKMPLSTDCDEMVRIMNELLAKIKIYRDKEYPLKK